MCPSNTARSSFSNRCLGATGAQVLLAVFSLSTPWIFNSGVGIAFAGISKPPCFDLRSDLRSDFRRCSLFRVPWNRQFPRDSLVVNPHAASLPHRSLPDERPTSLTAITPFARRPRLRNGRRIGTEPSASIALCGQGAGSERKQHGAGCTARARLFVWNSGIPSAATSPEELPIWYKRDSGASRAAGWAAADRRDGQESRR